MDMSTDYESAVEYRLNNIEKVLGELKDVMIENKMQARDIDELRKICSETLTAINAHDKRIRELEMAPLSTKADKWKTLVDIIWKLILGGLATVVTVVVTTTLSKLGVK